MKKYILLLALIPSVLFAQNNGDSLKFEIIKATVNFFATDSISYKTLKGKTLICAKVDYSCISDFCKKNDVASIQKKIDEWQKTPSANGEDLTKLVSKITTDLSAKEHRKKLDSFKKFSETVNQLAASFSDAPVEEPSKETVVDGAPEKEPLVVTETTEKDSANSGSKLPLISLILSIFALVLGGLAFMRSSKGSSSQGSEKSNLDYLVLKEDLKTLSNTVRQKQSVDLSPIQSSVKSLESRITNLENRSPTVELSVTNQIPKQEQKQVTNQQSSSTVKYARYPDMSNGFTNGALKDSQNGELIFEIQVSGNNASFSVSDDSSAQAFALSDYKNYLSDACDLANQPSKGCRIITQSIGSLSKSGSNWIIQNKAKIEFK